MSSIVMIEPALFNRLQHAREARNEPPNRVNQPSELAEVRIPIPDRPGAAAEAFTLAAELGVNIASFEVVHSVEELLVSLSCWSTWPPPSSIAAG